MFGPGKDVLVNNCSMEVEGDGEIDLGPDKDRMETNMLISASRLDGGADHDELLLTNNSEYAEGYTADQDLPIRAISIDNFEEIEVAGGGQWALQGDFRQADILISGGTISIPLQRRRSSRLRAKSFAFEEGSSMTVDLSNTDIKSKTLAGRWAVLQARGLKKEMSSHMDLMSVTLPDGYDYEFELKPRRLFLDLTIATDSLA